MQNEETEKRTVEFEMNLPQITARLVNANETWMLVGRGGGKTVGGIAPFLVNNVYALPRSSAGIFGLSFEHLDANTMPPIVKALADLDYHEDVHFVYGKRPPDSWPKPYIPVLNFKQAIIWNNGTSIQKVSLKRKASANALSLQWGIFDEVKFMQPQQLYDEIFPIFRGNEKYFSHKSEYLSKFFATDKKMEYAKIKWILDKRHENNWQLINTVITLQLDLNKKIMEHEGSTGNKKTRLSKEIKELKVMLNALRKNLVYVCEASALENIHFLGGEKWLKDKLRNTKNTYDFEITYLNKDPDAAEVLYYPDFKEDYHGYNNNKDIDTNLPFIIAADYQHSISPICVTQINDLVYGYKCLNFVDEVFTMAPKGLTDAVNLFCKRYTNHQRKKVYYVHDHTAIGKRNDADSFDEIVIKSFKKNGWKVSDIYMGDAPDQSVKYEQIKKILKEGETGMLRVRANINRCKHTILSLKNAEAITKYGKTQKNKTDEKDKDIDQSITTHFSDTFDQLLWAVIVLKLIHTSNGQGARITVR